MQLQCYKGFGTSAAPNMNDVYKHTNTYPTSSRACDRRAHTGRDLLKMISTPLDWIPWSSIFGSYPCYLRIFFPVIFSQVRSQKNSFIGKTPKYSVKNSVPFGPKQSTFSAKIPLLSPTFREGGAGVADIGLLPKKGLHCGPSLLRHLYYQSKKYSTSC